MHNSGTIVSRECSPPSFRGALRASPESISTAADFEHDWLHIGPTRIPWLWIPGLRQAAHPGMTEERGPR
jgi:hypothetical protein